MQWLEKPWYTPAPAASPCHNMKTTDKRLHSIYNSAERNIKAISYERFYVPAHHGLFLCSGPFVLPLVRCASITKQWSESLIQAQRPGSLMKEDLVKIWKVCACACACVRVWVCVCVCVRERERERERRMCGRLSQLIPWKGVVSRDHVGSSRRRDVALVSHQQMTEECVLCMLHSSRSW